MFDGKVVNALTDTKSTQSCNICGCKPSEVNNLKLVRSKPVDEDALQYGISILHFWLRPFTYVLNLGYKGDIKKFKAETPEQKLSVQERKKKIQSEFRDKLSLAVDMPKAGSGNTNDGNTARRAFASPDIFAEITGVKVEVIMKLRTVLIAFSSGLELNLDKFTPFSHETSEYLVKHYDWYKVPPSVHKMLEHGSQAAAKFDLAIGLYSEEAQEAQNKIFRNARLYHSAKISRVNAMKNQIHHLLIRSDPKISTISVSRSTRI